MDIYVVQQGDSIMSIAESFGFPAARLILDNGIENPFGLVTGQAIVIAHPEQTHIVQEGDTLAGIADTYGVGIMQLLRNNSFLSDREYLYPGETLVIRYHTGRSLTTNGFVYPYVNRKTLLKTLPYLTYISVFNYGITATGGVITYFDISDLVPLVKAYGVVPLLMISALSPTGEANIEVVYDILLSEENQEQLLNNVLDVLKSKEYYGVNVILSQINRTNQSLYINYLRKVSERLREEGFLLFVTINPETGYTDSQVTFERLDYTSISQLVDDITFLQYTWGTNLGPPAPVSNITLLNSFLDYVVSMVSPELLSLGKPLFGYLWELPYVPDRSVAYSLTLNSVISLANDVGAVIQFDEVSQTPFLQYVSYKFGTPVNYIIWSIDARSIDALNKSINKYGLAGNGVWNIMIYYQQLWTLINSQYEIVKILPDSFKNIT